MYANLLEIERISIVVLSCHRLLTILAIKTSSFFISYFIDQKAYFVLYMNII